MSDAITILRPVRYGAQVAKTFTVASNGQVVKRDFPDVKTFHVTVAPVDGIEALHHTLLSIEADATACVIRGQPDAKADLSGIRRQKRQNGGLFDDVARHWIMVDADKIKLPAGSSVIDDPVDVAGFLVDLFGGLVPELEGVSAIVQFSSSAGLEEMADAEAAAGLPPRWGGVCKRGSGIGAHLWFWLNVAHDGEALDRWAKAINAKVGNKAIDPATLRTVQPHYTAGPIFGAGLRDPLVGRRTVIIRGSADAATLVIPAKASQQEYKAGTNNNLGIGFAGLLDRIGSPLHGFHDPINAAIASFIGSNGHDADVGALVDMLRERIAAADPGGRSPGEISRYADADRLRLRIDWTLSREAEKQEARRAEREAAGAVDPTFPDRAVTLAEGRRQAAEAIDGFAQRLQAGETPEMLLRMTVGGGKSEIAVNAVARLLDAAAIGKREGALLYLVPRHDLGGEIVERIAAAHPGQQLATWRGLGADDPHRPGVKMCLDPDLTAAAGAAGLDKTVVCPACPLQGACGYNRQRQQRANVWIAAHNLAFQGRPQGLPKPALAVIDEAFWGVAVSGLDAADPIQLALSSLDSDRTGNLRGIARQRLLDLRRRAASILAYHEPGAFMREAFEAGGFTAETAREWHVAEWSTKPAVKFVGDWERTNLLDALASIAGQGFTALRPMLAKFVWDLLEGNAARSVNVALVPEANLGRDQGTGPAIRFAWRQDFVKWVADAPKLFLDATTPVELVRRWAPKIEAVEIEIQAPAQQVRQVIGREFGRAFFQQNPNNVARLADLVVVDLAEAAGDVLVVAQKVVEAALKKEMTRRFGGALPPRLHLAHHGAITGLDKFRAVDRVVVVGRPAVNRITGERLAEVIAGGPGRRGHGW